MKLTKLELSGFKSFADTVTLTFEEGVTAIVGPNGCGKSNVSDSVRWVLGEQSARLLRGGKMEDVIFQGSTGRRPVNVTEVSLFLDNSDGELPTPYTEVVITRRLDPYRLPRGRAVARVVGQRGAGHRRHLSKLHAVQLRLGRCVGQVGQQPQAVEARALRPPDQAGILTAGGENRRL